MNAQGMKQLIYIRVNKYHINEPFKTTKALLGTKDLADSPTPLFWRDMP
jgi:hypothetical protein